MYGAILGDMIGAPYEFDRGSKRKDFEMFNSRVRYTDDSAMTLAVCKALMLVGRDATEQDVKAAVVREMQDIGNRYAQGEYGGRFSGWLKSSDPKPYNSFGNGSAKRVSSVGWMYDDLDKTREVARWTAEVTHNHPEGIKGAESVAAAIFMARTGSSKEEIRKYVEDNFGYVLSRTCDEIRPAYRHDESCQGTVPEAFTAFFEGNGFEDVIRTAVSLGGDCDTLTCIAGAIAEAFYGVPEWMKEECDKRLPKELGDILGEFKEYIGDVGVAGDVGYAGGDGYVGDVGYVGGDRSGGGIYSGLTSLIDGLRDDEYGKMHYSEGHKGTEDDPLVWPYVEYSQATDDLVNAVYAFVDAHPEYELHDYRRILDENGIESVDDVDAASMDGKVVMAALVCIVRGERFCDGLLLSNLKSGNIQRMLERLKEIDETGD